MFIIKTIKMLYHGITSIRTNHERNFFYDQHQHHSKWCKTSGSRYLKWNLQTLIVDANNSKFFHKLLSYNLKQHIQIRSITAFCYRISYTFLKNFFCNFFKELKNYFTQKNNEFLYFQEKVKTNLSVFCKLA